MPEKTLLYDLHVAHNARIFDFHGWLLPVQYEGIIAEHNQCRQSASLFDTSHMGQFLFSGPTCAQDISRLLTRNVVEMKLGQCRLGMMLREDGGIIDDTVVLKLGEEEFLLFVNAGTREGDLEWIKSHIDPQTSVVDQTFKWGKVDVQGPLSYKVLAGHVEDDLSSLRYYTGMRTRCMGTDAIITRSGYTGELGYEVCASGQDIVEIARVLLENPALKPAGLGARDLLRLEMGYHLSGQDFNSSTNAAEVDIDRLLRSDHGYIGNEAVKRMRQSQPERILVALIAETRRKMSTHDQIIYDGQVVGEITSGAFSPSLNASIAMGYVKRSLNEVNTELIVKTQRAEITAKVTSKPMYKDGTCRTTQLEPVNEHPQ